MTAISHLFKAMSTYSSGRRRLLLTSYRSFENLISDKILKKTRFRVSTTVWLHETRKNAKWKLQKAVLFWTNPGNSCPQMSHDIRAVRYYVKRKVGWGRSHLQASYVCSHTLCDTSCMSVDDNTHTHIYIYIYIYVKNREGSTKYDKICRSK